MPLNVVQKITENRLFTGLTLAFIGCALAAAGGWFWAGTVLVIIAQGFKELNEIFKAKSVSPSKVIIWGSAVLFVLAAVFQKQHYFQPLLILSIIASFFWQLFRMPRGGISDIGATLLSLFYIVFLPVHFILLRNVGADLTSNPFEQPGMGYLLFSMFTLSFSDVGAYYFGKAFGKHPLYPDISPKKTREGAFGGIIVGILVGQIVAWLIQFPWQHALALGLILIIVGQLGDLTESLLKRDAGLKDSSSLLKSHGGLLDRIDSYIFSGVVSYYYIHWVILKQGLAQEVLGLFYGGS